MVTENNDLGVTLTDYEIEIIAKNRHAGIITMFVWKVPESNTEKVDGVFCQKVSLKDTSQKITTPYSASETDLTSFLLGPKTRLEVVLHGYDEIGRPILLHAKTF